VHPQPWHQEDGVRGVQLWNRCDVALPEQLVLTVHQLLGYPHLSSSAVGAASGGQESFAWVTLGLPYHCDGPLAAQPVGLGCPWSTGSDLLDPSTRSIGAR
jgi:hypothetical protein